MTSLAACNSLVIDLDGRASVAHEAPIRSVPRLKISSITEQEEQMKDVSASRKTCAVVLVALGLTFGSLAHAAGGSDKDEGKRTLSRETTHGNESTIGNKKPGTSGSGASKGSGNTSPPQGSALGGSSTDKFSNTDTGGGGSGSGAPLQGGVTTNKQGTSGGANSAGGMRGGTGQSGGQGSRSGSGSGGSGSGGGSGTGK
jgi:hypothetical protein